MDMRRRRLLFVVAPLVVAAAATAVLVFAFGVRSPPPLGATTVGERLDSLKSERATLQARADGQARIELIGPLRVASLLSDALAAGAAGAGERSLDRMPAPWRQAYAELDALNMALKDALARPGAGATLAARTASRRAETALGQLANGGAEPLVLSFTPHFVPPRRATGELTLAPRAAASPPLREGDVRLDDKASARPEATVAPTVPRYAPDFASAREEDPPVPVEIVGLHLGGKGATRVLAVGDWRGEGQGSAERLHFVVPRAAFATAAARTTLVAGTLAIRRDGGRTAIFELPFVVLPDRPGSMAFDQLVHVSVPESRSLVSPEILARAGVGETRTVHRCFDPPVGWRFDKASSRVVVVERLAWVDDISDTTMNAGSVEFSSGGEPDQICVDVVARPAAKTARTATIGRFEATLVRDRLEDRAVKSGVRTLDWHEPVRLRIDDGAVQWKLYVRLFDEINAEFPGPERDGKLVGLPFLHIALENGNKTLVLAADPKAVPRE